MDTEIFEQCVMENTVEKITHTKIMLILYLQSNTNFQIVYKKPIKTQA